MGRLTLEEVRERFEKKGYRLLENNYINSNQKLHFKCMNHPDKDDLYITVNNLHKQGCKYCGMDSRRNKNRKNSIESVSVEFEKKGYRLLESVYENVDKKMKFTCNEHPDEIQYVSLYNLRKSKHNCKTCKRESMNKDKKHSFEYVFEEFKSRGFKLLESEYINNSTEMKYICDNGHKTTITFRALISGAGCKECANEKLGESKRTSYEDVRLMFEDRGFNLLTKDFKNSDTVLYYTCSKHPKEIYSINLRRLKAMKVGCPECVREHLSDMYSKENHWMWKGGATYDNKKIRLSSDYRKWRENVLSRDNFSCKKCNGIKNLHAHHILNFSEHEDSRFDVNNGITLCKDCHKKFHSIYGYSNNNKCQIRDFMMS